MRQNLLPNNPFTTNDILPAKDILGPNIGSSKGKTTHQQPHKVTNNIPLLDPTIRNWYKNITLCADLMFVNKIPFLVTIPRNIWFSTAEALNNQSNTTILAAILRVQQVYQMRGFSFNLLLADGQFTSMRGSLANNHITLNDTGCNEHVGNIKQFICTVKELTCSVYNTLPFNKIPRRVLIEMIYFSIY
jgi:hypothetical protein